jgi:cell division topological specificity factor
MSFLSQLFAKRSSAPVARDRLQILLAHERAHGGAGNEGQSELIAKLREEILDVIARHVPIDRDKVQIKLDRGAAVSTLEIDIEVPQLSKAAAPKDGAKPGPGPGPGPAAGSREAIARNLDAKTDPASGKKALPTGP